MSTICPSERREDCYLALEAAASKGEIQPLADTTLLYSGGTIPEHWGSTAVLIKTALPFIEKLDKSRTHHVSPGIGFESFLSGVVVAVVYVMAASALELPSMNELGIRVSVGSQSKLKFGSL